MRRRECIRLLGGAAAFGPVVAQGSRARWMRFTSQPPPLCSRTALGSAPWQLARGCQRFTSANLTFKRAALGYKNTKYLSKIVVTDLRDMYRKGRGTWYGGI
jgi:hypothetical protein